MKLSVAGTGYVGLVAGVCFAEKGHTVTCVDVDEEKIARMREGVSPIYEAGLEELLKKNLASGRLFFTSDYQSAYADADAIFIGVGPTPAPAQCHPGSSRAPQAGGPGLSPLAVARAGIASYPSGC